MLAAVPEHPEILALWQKKFQYILVDEFQDISPIQYDIVKMLAAPENNLFIVGDDDQSIYRFRGASPEIMLNFPRDYPEAETVNLNVNYRCTPEILEASVRLIRRNQKRFAKELRASRDRGEPVRWPSLPGQPERDARGGGRDPPGHGPGRSAGGNGAAVPHQSGLPPGRGAADGLARSPLS